MGSNEFKDSDHGHLLHMIQSMCVQFYFILNFFVSTKKAPVTTDPNFSELMHLILYD